MYDFQEDFPTEEACEKHLRKMRWPDGFRCPRCGHGEAWFIRTRKLFDCKSCRKKISLTAGTIFHKTRIPLMKWYRLIHRMATASENGVSISEMQRELEIADYKTVWMMAHKIRKAMAFKITGYNLTGLVQIDASFFETQTQIPRKDTGNEESKKVLCATMIYRDTKGYVKASFVHMKISQKESPDTYTTFLEEIGYGSKTMKGKNSLSAFTKGHIEINYLTEYVDLLTEAKILFDENLITSWDLSGFINKVLNNAKDVIYVTHHKVSEKHLQSYLDEICFRENYRHFPEPIFDLLIKACIATETDTYSDLVNR
ncbi:MAG: IS1595 family transposase [Desulfobacteraceae bacterium]|nr:IS1595 family transposase [Desulfobacteraceae bacterium]